MRKIGTIFIIGLMLVSSVMAGGIVSNSNQSADFIRMLNRNASLDADAVYFNPAGITLLNEGLSFYLSSQTITQDRIVKSDVPTLTSDTFNGDTFVPVFPNFYIAYKTGNLAFGAGFTPIGGGGSAVFDDGLPAFAVPVSLVPAGLVAAGIPTTNYSMDVAFDGSSTYLGGQAVVSYKINDMISVAAGARYFSATNTYEGHIKDIMINPNDARFGVDGSMISAPGFFTTASAGLAAGAAGATAGAAQLQPFIDLGAGTFTFDQLLGAQMVDQATVDAIVHGFALMGITIDTATMTPITAQATAIGAAAAFTAQSEAMAANAVATGDIEVDAKQTGTGFAPIVGVYVSPMEGLGIGLRYEGKATMEMTNETKVDGSGLFPDGAKTNADMPATIGVGVSYMVMPSLRVVADFNYYMNENVDWDGREKFVENGTEMGIGAEFAVSEALLLSGGFLTGKSGAKTGYHTDLSHTFDSVTIGGGGRYFINPNLYLSFGVSSTTYEDIKNDGVSYRGLITGNETYDKTALAFAIGVGFSR
jgi:long-subunit fatty acid transport protein